MPLWQIALAALGVAWSIQALGTWVQMRHYSAVMGEASRTWSDGFIGAGNARSTLGAGIILLLIISPDRTVRRLLIMKGRSVFARFARVPDVEGSNLAALDGNPVFRDGAKRKALTVALNQVEKAAARARGENNTGTG
jgi:glucitol operon activator protein